MRYLLMLNSSPADLERRPEDPASADYWESWRAYMGASAPTSVTAGVEAPQPESAAASATRRNIHMDAESAGDGARAASPAMGMLRGLRDEAPRRVSGGAGACR